jgi:hypothetical protein
MKKKMEENIVEKYKEIESDLIPVMNFLKKNIEQYHEYKGFFTLRSPLIYKPEILFLGYNVGDGHYKETKNLSLCESLYNNTIQLEWFEENSSRGGEINGIWKKFKWYERDKPVNNSLPKNMIDLLYEVAKAKEKFKKESEKNESPYWYEDFGKKIMFTNLYPVATTNIADLTKINNRLSQEEELLEIWKPMKKDNEKLNNWIVRKFFLSKIHKLIKLVQPRIIVCLGKSTMSDFTYGKFEKYDKFFIGNEKDCTVLGFSRSGNWSSIIPELAKKIIENQINI